MNSNVLGLLDLARDLITKVNEKFNEFSVRDNISTCMNQLIIMWGQIWNKQLTEPKKVIKEVEQKHALILKESFENSDTIIQRIFCEIYWILIIFYLESNDWEHAVKYIKKRHEIALDIGDYYLITFSFRNYYDIYPKIKELIDPVVNSKKGLAFFEAKNDIFYIIKNAIYVSDIYYGLGYLHEALETLNKYLGTVKTIMWASEGEINNIFNFYYTIGTILSDMGKFEKAISTYQVAERFANILKKDHFYSSPLTFVYEAIGEVFEDLGNFKEALYYQELSYNLQTKDDSIRIQFLSESYYQLIKINLDLDQTDEAKKLFSKFSNEIQKWKDFSVVFENTNAKFFISQALLAVKENSIQSISQAQDLLQQVIDNTNIKNELIIDAIKPLIELSIQEYKIFQNPKTLMRIKSLIDKFSDFVNKFNSIPLKIQSMIIKSKLELAFGNYNEFKSVLKNAKDLATEYNLINYISLIDTENSKVNSEAEKWKPLLLIQNNTPKSEEIKEYLERAKEILSVKDIQDKLVKI